MYYEHHPTHPPRPPPPRDRPPAPAAGCMTTTDGTTSGHLTTADNGWTAAVSVRRVRLYVSLPQQFDDADSDVYVVVVL